MGVHDLNFRFNICHDFGFRRPGVTHERGQDAVQVMEYVLWKTFGRIIERQGGDAGVRILDCSDLFRVMAFSELTWRESLRDIEACLAVRARGNIDLGVMSLAEFGERLRDTIATKS